RPSPRDRRAAAHRASPADHRGAARAGRHLHFQSAPNFFPYSHSFLRAMIPVPANHVCCDIGRDIYYMEDKTD
ncbi:MAG TPA: hypothetical protein VGI22_11150, partial [Xanthobacteraceae bacterium]